MPARIREGAFKLGLEAYKEFTRENQRMKCILGIHAFTHLFYKLFFRPLCQASCARCQ